MARKIVFSGLSEVMHHPSLGFPELKETLEAAGFDLSNQDDEVREEILEHNLRYAELLRTIPDLEIINLKNKLTKEELEALTGAEFYGYIPSRQTLHWSIGVRAMTLGDNEVGDYTRFQTIRERMGRHVERINYSLYDDEPMDIGEYRAWESVKDSFGDEVFVKDATDKGPNVFTTKEHFDRDMSMAFGPHTVCFLVQDVVDFVDEYRFFIYGQKVVSGAPRVLAHHCGMNLDSSNPYRNFFCPDNDSDQLGYKRLREDEEQADRYWEFAQQTVDALAIEEPRLSNYVLDVGTIVSTDGEREIAVVELNSESNAGTFANDLPAIVRAKVAHPSHLVVEVD